ncbi:MAG: excinuclease ABC subunit B, partial [Candidatus Omnitrophota bacterium]|nr:excinuclease ABC subunit B [Candidatus Omnitrophota bacterium]
MPEFKLTSNLKPQGDQPQAIKILTDSVLKGNPYQTLLGVTGSGKTFTLAHVINNVKKP